MYKKLFTVAIILLLTTLAHAQTDNNSSQYQRDPENYERELQNYERTPPQYERATIEPESEIEIYVIDHVIDGGTLQITNGEQVRLIGIDAPESNSTDKAKRDAQKAGKDLATEFVKSLELEGKAVRLEFDIQARDKTGPLLAYVFTPVHPRMVNSIVVADESCKIPDTKIFMKAYKDCEANLNATMIKAGYASHRAIPPNVKYADLFEELYQEALDYSRGLWAKDTNSAFKAHLNYPMKKREGPTGVWKHIGRHGVKMDATF